MYRASSGLFVPQHLVKLDIMIECPENGKHRVLSSKLGELSVVRKTQSMNLNQLKFHQTGKQLNTRHGDYINLLLTLSVSVDKQRLLTRKLQDAEVTQDVKQILENE